MKLTEIQIDCHGPWRNLTLPVRGDGMSVFYGPNEAGKTTLRQFIKGLLFGFSGTGEANANGGTARLPAAGSLQFTDASGSHRIHRAALGVPSDSAGRYASDGAVPVDGQLDGFLNGIDERLFEHVFALGLRELAELNALSDGDVGRHLFGASLGPDGERILSAAGRAAAHRSRLIDPLQADGELVKLFERHDGLTARLNELGDLHERHAEWSLRRDQLEREIADLRKRIAGTAEQLRGHEFLERAWGPWDRIRECRRELDGLPEIAGFPERGLERLERLDSEIAAAAESRDHVLVDVRRMKEDMVQPAEEALRRELAPAMRGFVEQREWLAGLSARRSQALQAVQQREFELNAACAELGSEWSAGRVEAADVSAVGQRRLAGTAESFRSAVTRRRAIARNCRRTAGACRDLKESLAEGLHDLDGRSIDAALAETRARIAVLNQLAALRIREAELAQRSASLNQQRERMAPQATLPRWVYFVLGVFGFMGVILAGWGLLAGATTSGIAGVIYAMLGVTCGGLAWGLKIQYEGDLQGRLADVETAAAAVSCELEEVRNQMRQISGGEPDGGDPSELVCQAQSRIGELVELAANMRRLSGMRRKLAAGRKKLATARREVATARRNWTELLAKFGFPDTLEIDQALAAWQVLVQAAEKLATWKQARHELQTVSGIWDGYCARIAELARHLPEEIAEGFDPLEVLAAWREQLAALDRSRQQRRELRVAVQSRQRQARECNQRVESLKLKRNALLVQGGAATPDEFEERARSFARRTFLADQLHDAQRDLDALSAAHRDLALVEEDLERFDARQNSDCVEMLRLELADLESDLERSFEHLGKVKREIESLENDNQSTKVRFELRLVEEQVRLLAGEWAACESAAAAIDGIRRDFERTHQPRAIAEVAKLFSRMTGGRYRSVWSPLGERRLIIEDGQGRSFPVQSLSRATREQLLLAVRLAVVRELAGQGISLPLILDDVLVNFDEERAVAAADLLIELAEQGQQVLFFTCHKHLAQLFASRGVEPVWLPGPAQPATERDEKRLAG